MKVEVWKCPHTGKLFEDEVAFDAHQAELERENQLNASQVSLLERLEQVRRRPFDEATTVQNLMDRIVATYPEALDLMVQTGQLPAGGHKRRVLEVLDVSKNAVLAQVDRLAGALDVWEGTRCFEGFVTCVYDTADFDGAASDDISTVFPLLAAGVPEKLIPFFGTAGALELGDNRFQVTAHIVVLLESTPLLATKYAQYQALRREDLDTAERARAERVGSYRHQDPEFARASASVAVINQQMMALQAELQKWQARLTQADERAHDRALRSVPLLAQLAALEKELLVT